jgi:hypothetical protein
MIWQKTYSVVKMIQMSQYGWKIVSQKGNVLQEGIYFANLSKAEEYIKAYISSYLNWTYEMVPLTKEDPNDTE